MDDEIFKQYQDMKKDVKISPVTLNGVKIDGWVEEFLRNNPTKEQFIKIFDDCCITAALIFAIWGRVK